MVVETNILYSNGLNIQQRKYIDNTSYKDEWYLTSIQYCANIYNYYDMGYPVRYGESASVAANQINSYINAVSKQYLRLFGLEIKDKYI